VAQTDEFEADWQRARPSKLPWILLAASILTGAFVWFMLSGQRDDALRQLAAAREQMDAVQKKNLDILGQKSALEKRVSDLERENKLLAERKVEPVKDAKADAKKPPAKPTKPTKKKKSS
jgi:septal ring factor EnvC (AmiA/AmiB activator)